MNRIAWMVFRSLPFVPIWFYKICRYGSTKDRHTEQERYDFLRSIVKKVNRSGRVTVEIHGCFLTYWQLSTDARSPSVW